MKYKVLCFVAMILALVSSSPAAAVEYEPLYVSPGTMYDSVRAVDWNGDGDMEVLAGNFYGNAGEVWDYDPVSGEMVLIESVPLAYNPRDVAAADLDHDGDIDVVGCIRFFGTYVHLNQGGGTWTTDRVGDWYCASTEIADFDGDGNLDIFSSVDYGYAHMFYGDGSGNFTQGPAPISEFPYGGAGFLNVVDFNFDGRPDLLGVAAYYYHPYKYLRAYPNLSTPGNPAWGATIGPMDEVVNMYGGTPSVADFDGNGYFDCAASIDGDPVVWWGQGDGVNFWWTRSVVADYADGMWCGPRTADVDRDGDPDIVVSGFEGAPYEFDGLRFHSNDGTGNFTYDEYTADHPMGGVKFGDVNGDGVTDIMAYRLYGLDGFGFDVLLGTRIDVALDIKPGACPNPIQMRGRGFLQVAILGSADFDVEQIDTSTILLEGVAPIRFIFEDVATPFEPTTGKEDCQLDCLSVGPDGWKDLVLKFISQDVVSALGVVGNGMCVVPALTGNLMEEFGRTPFQGEDVVLIQSRGGTALPSVEGTVRDPGRRKPTTR